MPNVTEADYRKMNIDQSFKAYQRDDLKVIYKIKLDVKIIFMIDISLLKF